MIVQIIIFFLMSIIMHANYYIFFVAYINYCSNNIIINSILLICPVPNSFLYNDY